MWYNTVWYYTNRYHTINQDTNNKGYDNFTFYIRQYSQFEVVYQQENRTQQTSQQSCTGN